MAGKYFEDFEVGRVYRHELSRTMTLSDSIQYTCLTMDTEPTYLDEEWAKQHARFKRIEIHPYYALSVIQGYQVKDLTMGTTLGNLGLTDVTFPNPVFPGDTLYGRTTILAKRESQSKPDRGVVEFLHEGFNQRGEVVARCRRTGMMKKRGVE